MTIVENLRMKKGYMTSKDVASVLGLHPLTIYKYARTGTIPHLRLGGRLKFDPILIAAWIVRREIG